MISFLIRWLGKTRRLEWALVSAVFAAGVIGGMSYHQAFRSAGGREDFGQREFAAAVALACGHGFVDIGYSLTPELDEFLALKRDTFDCATLPAAVPHAPPNLTQGLYRYLMSAVAMTWRLGAVSWSSVSPLFGVAYGLTLAAAFMLFRMGMGRSLALMMTLAVALSAVHLGYLPHLRDYAKAPFILLLVTVMARLATSPLAPRVALSCSVAFGVIMGVGFGFRNDLLINWIPWIAVMFLCTKDGAFRNLPLKAACLGVSIAVFLVVAWPILRAYEEGSNSGHVALLGLMSAFDGPLGIAGSVYQWGYGYSDGLASTQINSYTYRLYGHPVSYFSASYDRAMVEYILRVVRDWPADILIRAYASVLKVLEFPFEVGVYRSAIPVGIDSPGMTAFYGGRSAILTVFKGGGVYLVGAALALLAGTSLRLSFGLLIFVFYFSGYPSIQFDARHFFHLEFIAWWALGFLMQCAVDTVRGRQSTLGLVMPPPMAAAQRALIFAATALAMLGIPVAALRLYQGAHVNALVIERYLGAKRVPVPIVAQPLPGDRTLMAMPYLWRERDPRKTVNTVYIVAAFSRAGCAAEQSTVTFRYRSRTTATDFSYDTTVAMLPGHEPTLVFFAGYNSDGWNELAGVELPTADAGCLAGVFELDRAEYPDLLLNLTLTPQWQQARLYQTLTRFEVPFEGDGRPFIRYSYPYGQLPVSFANLVPAIPVAHERPDSGQTINRNDGWEIDGRPEAAYATLLRYRPQTLPAGSTFALAGHIHAGKISVGLLKDGRWAGLVNVVTRGPFVATIGPVEDAGDYEAVIADYSEPPWASLYLPKLRGFIPTYFLRPGKVKVRIATAGWSHSGQKEAVIRSVMAVAR